MNLKPLLAIFALMLNSADAIAQSNTSIDTVTKGAITESGVLSS